MRSAQLFRGYIPGGSFITAAGFRGFRVDSNWSQYLLAALTNDDAELAEIALQSSLADVTERVEGGRNGSAYSIGEHGFYADNQFHASSDEMKRDKRERLERVLHMSEAEWREADAAIDSTVRHSAVRFMHVIRGDTFLAMAIREDAYGIASLLLERAPDLLLATNDEQEDAFAVCRQQCSRLNLQLRALGQDKLVRKQRVCLPSELARLRCCDDALLDKVRRMIAFLDKARDALELKRAAIDSERLVRRKFEIRNQAAPPELVFNLTHETEIGKSIEGLLELVAFMRLRLDAALENEQLCIR